MSAPRLTAENDPYLANPPDPEHSPWRRFVVVGDSMAAGIGDPVPGYGHLGWADRVARRLGGDYLNLGRRNLLAGEVRSTQLEPALAFSPDLAAVCCGGNDLMRAAHDPAAVEREVDAIVGALRAAGSDVIMFAPFDISRTELVSEEHRLRWRTLIERMSELAERVTRRHGALLVDFRGHPAGAEPGIYSEDRIHLNTRGQAICAAETLRALERWAVGSRLEAA